MAYRIAPFPMKLNDLHGHTSLFKCAIFHLFVTGPCLWNSLPVTLRDETSHLYSLRDLWRHFGLSRAAAHSDRCFFAPCTNILTYLLTYLSNGYFSLLTSTQRNSNRIMRCHQQLCHQQQSADYRQHFDDHSYGPVDINKVDCMKVCWWHPRLVCDTEHLVLAMR